MARALTGFPIFDFRFTLKQNFSTCFQSRHPLESHTITTPVWGLVLTRRCSRGERACFFFACSDTLHFFKRAALCVKYAKGCQHNFLKLCSTKTHGTMMPCVLAAANIHAFARCVEMSLKMNDTHAHLQKAVISHPLPYCSWCKQALKCTLWGRVQWSVGCEPTPPIPSS